MMSKKSQVWIETAIYILIGLSIIAILLAAAVPEIEKTKDRITLRETMDALDTLNNKIIQIEQSPGSAGTVDFRISKGSIEVEPENESITYRLDNTRFKLSQPGTPVEEGVFDIMTEEYGSRFNIIIKMDLKGRVNMTYKGDDNKNLVLHQGATPYHIYIENVGDNPPNDKTHINFDII